MNTLTPTQNTAARMFEAGRLTVTFTSPKTGEHITVTTFCRKPDEDTGKWGICSLADAKIVAFEVPNDLGFNDKIGKYTDGKGFVAAPGADPARVFCAKQLLALVTGKPMAAGLVAQEAARCGKCYRELRDPVSIERGIGPECYGADTGSTHQAKVKQPKTTAPVEETPAETQTRYGNTSGMLGTPAIARKPMVKGDGKDAQGVAFGHGDWRARKAVARETLDADRKSKGTVEREWSMDRIFPETGSPIPY